MPRTRKLRFQFRLRKFLVLTITAGLAPWLYVQHRHRCEVELWNAYDEARTEREDLVQRWRVAYAALVEGKGHSSTESDLRQRYLTLRSHVEKKWEEIRSFYGTSPKERPPSTR